MSGVEENKDAAAATNDPPGESPPDNPPIIDGSPETSASNSDTSSESSPNFSLRISNDNVKCCSSAPPRLETRPFVKPRRMIAGLEVGPDGFPVGPYISLRERMRQEALNNPPDPAPPAESSSSEEHHQSSDEDPNTRIPFPGGFEDL